MAWNIVYWLLKSICFEFFEDGKYSLYWVKELMEIWYLLITEKFLFWTFREWEIRSFLETKTWWRNDICWLLKRSWFEVFGEWETRSFLRQKVNGKMIFSDYRRVLLLSYRKILVLNFSVLGNKVFTLAKTLI